jgi:MYXO-CTERM domain-containing protein
MSSGRLVKSLPIVLILTISFAGRAHASSITADGGFESAAINDVYSGAIGDGWTVTQGHIGINPSGVGDGVPRSGNQMAYLSDGFLTLNTLSQSLTTVGGQQYLISFWVADTAANPLTVNFGSQVVFSGNAPTNGVTLASEYQNISVTLTALSTSTNLTFTGEFTAGNGTLLDDVSVTAVSSAPEPATFGFTALGAVALFALRRKRA